MHATISLVATSFHQQLSEMVNKSPRWTQNEDEKLRTLAATETPATIAERLGRSETAILHRGIKLGLAFRGQVLAFDCWLRHGVSLNGGAAMERSPACLASSKSGGIR
jgi:hypothetical protein